MDNLKDLLTTLSVVIVIIVGAATVVAFFRVNLAKTQIELLRGDRDDQEKRIERLEGDLELSKKDKEKQDAIIREQNNKIRILERVVTGREQLDHIIEQLANHDHRVDERHDTLLHRFTEFEDRMLARLDGSSQNVDT